ncbi:MAG: hypothetical protein ACP5VP_03610 [Candidatus Limnocylindrales bacterium]
MAGHALDYEIRFEDGEPLVAPGGAGGLATVVEDIRALEVAMPPHLACGGTCE